MFNIIIALLLVIITCITVYRQIIEHFEKRDSQVIYDIVKKLEKHFPKIKRLEFYEGDESFTLNKKKVYICTKDKHGVTYNSNILTYVILHEYAHSICPEIGHTPLYKSIFSDIISKSIYLGLYKADGKFPEDYCN
jgi:hypothetical protein